MPSKKGSNQFPELITDTGRKVIKQLGWIILISICFILTDEYYLKGTCQKQNQLNSQNQSNSLQCMSSPLIGGLGWNLLQIAITIWFVDIGLKRETIDAMHKIFNSAQATKHIKGFYSNRGEYSRLIEDNFQDARADQEIRLLCLSEEISIFQGDNLRSIRNKVIDGCKIKILILHPESSLLKCLESVGFTPAFGKSMLANLSVKLNRLYEDLERLRDNRNIKIKGSIEVKLHKDLFSPIGYYSDSKGFEFVWMYFSDDYDGNEYPAFHIANQELIEKTNKHFDNLWQKTVGDEILLRVTPINNINDINNTSKIFPPPGGNRI